MTRDSDMISARDREPSADAHLGGLDAGSVKSALSTHLAVQLEPSLDASQRMAARRKREMSRASFLLLIAMVDYLALISALAFAGTVRFGTPFNAMIGNALLFISLIYPVCAGYGGAFSPQVLSDTRSSVVRGVRAAVLANILFIIALFCFKAGIEFSRVLIVTSIVASAAFIAAGRFVASWLIVPRARRHQMMDLAIVDDSAPPEQLPEGMVHVIAHDLELWPDASDRVQIDRLVSLCADYDMVRVYCPPDKRAAWTHMLRCLDTRSEIRLSDLDGIRPLELIRHGDRCLALISRKPLEWHQALTKRVLDLAVVLIALPFLLPLMAIFAIAIKVESPGPVLFRQERIGLGNRSFWMLKFRSMRHELSDGNGNMLTARNDARVTKVGAFIRKTSIDELPQIFNVLRGDMSIVGPRPHAYGAKAGNRLYWEVDSSYWQRHIAKPGITGLAQIRGFRGNTFEESDLQDRLDADLEYVSQWSLVRDIEIMFATLRVLVHDRAF
ncbi:sugar transferase [Sphingopyxis kveilinensis]|uniref:sugar transferase n=1 Tax=Sphingopyxis kveilinensis TaxID=3114367 RepID=UPI0030D093F3